MTRYSSRSRARHAGRRARGRASTIARAELAPVDVLGALLGDQLERPREIRHQQPVAGDETFAVRAVDAATLAVCAQDQVEDRVQIGLGRVELDAVAGELDRRRDELAPGQRAERAVRLLEAGERARHRARGSADVEDLRRAAA